MVEDLASLGAAFGAELDEVVGLGEQVEVVLDDDDGMALVDEAVQEAYQFFAVAEMEPDGGFFENVEIEALDVAAAFGVALQAFGEFGDELEALGFAAGKGGAALTEGEVAEAGLYHEVHDFAELGVEVEETGGFVEGHLQHVGDILALPVQVEQFGAVALAVAIFAGHEGIGHEAHLQLDAACPRTGFAASVGRVEGKAAWLVSTDL